MYIYRELLEKIKSVYFDEKAKGLILSGVVGCGKTTLIEKLLDELSDSFEIFSYSGDDSNFRYSVIKDSSYIYTDVLSKTTRRSLVFVDEVQKSEEIFDALKMAFDKGKISFIVSGSNPAYLSTVAKKRLQRRADQMLLLPIGIGELSVQNKWIDQDDADGISKILWHIKSIKDLKLPEVSIPKGLKKSLERYWSLGGLPLSILSKDSESSLREIKLTVERGFDLMSEHNNSIADLTRVELASLHSKEFTYKNIMERTRSRRRDDINNVIDNLVNHSYLVKKKPVLMIPGKTSYLSVFSYIDPGIISYLTGNLDVDLDRGQRIEGYIHSRLHYLIYNSVFKSSLGYFKPHSLDINKNVRYSPGEIDFIFQCGKKLVPIEVKSTFNIGDIDIALIKGLVKEHKLPFGVVVYGGVPHISKQDKIIYWPYWMI